jgi:hypothetical protein
MVRFMATLSEHPETKMLYGILMCSERQGVGKTTLTNIMSKLVGPHNSSFPSETSVVDSEFTDWKSNVRLVVVAEIYAGQSFKAYNKLKDTVTDKTVTINKKFLAPYTQENWCHIVACSNSMKALRIPDEDRRWFIPEITESERPFKYWQEFYQWLDSDGYSTIKWWLQEWLKKDRPVAPGARAPVSAAKIAMQKESKSPGMRIVEDQLAQWADDIKEDSQASIVQGINGQAVNIQMAGKSIVTTDEALQQLIANKLYKGQHSNHLESPLTIRRIAKNLGWHVAKEREFIMSGLGRSTVITTDPAVLDIRVKDLRKAIEVGMEQNVVCFFSFDRSY